MVSFIGIAGTWAGTGSSDLLAGDGVPDLFANAHDGGHRRWTKMSWTLWPKLTNMIIGSVKTDLESNSGPLGLSIPTVVFGRNFKTRSAGNAEWIHVRFLGTASRC